MKHAIGEGTANVSVNLLLRERDLLGREAVMRDMSLGGLIKTLVLHGLRDESPALAAAILAERQHHRAAQLAIA